MFFKSSVFGLVVVLAVVATAEPPRFLQLTSRSAAQTQESGAAPYPAAGYRPAIAFRLPARQQQNPQTVYGPPSTEYGPPADATTTEAAPTTTDQEPTTTEAATEEPQAEQIRKGKGAKSGKLTETDAEEVEPSSANNDNNGVYYLLLPNGQLQKVQFMTSADIANMAYKAQLQYSNVEPIRGPIFTYNPNAPLVQLFQH